MSSVAENSSPSDQQTTPTKVGLVGCGVWGRNILRDLLALDCQVLVSDTDQSVREWVTEHGAISAFPATDALPPCDGYVVAVPIPLLAAVSGALLARGQPVFAEKTLCLSLESADFLSSLAEVLQSSLKTGVFERGLVGAKFFGTTIHSN